MTDTDRKSKGRHGSDDHDGHGADQAPGKAQRSDPGAGAGAEAAQEAAADPVAELKAALAAGDGVAALSAWDKIPNSKQRKLAKDHGLLLDALQVIGPPAARVLKEAGSKPSRDIRFSQEILHSSAVATEWMKELGSAGLLRNFLKAEPRREKLDKKALNRLADFAGPEAPSDALAKAAYEKAWGKAKSGKFNDGWWTIQGAKWDRDHLNRMFQSLLTGGIPPAHLHGLRGIYIAKHYTDNESGKKEKLGFGYFVDSTIVMPLYKGEGGTTHDMVGGETSETEPMGHFQSTALHEVGHLVGDETGEHYWGTKSSSPLHMEESNAAEVKKELWDDGKSESVKGDDVLASDAKLYLEAEVRGEASAAFKSTVWHKDGKSLAKFRKNLEAQYAEQPLYKMAKAVAGNVGDAYADPGRGTQSKGKMFAYLTRFQGGWAKYNKEAWDAKVSAYSMSSAAEWFAEQYQYYMTQDGAATLPEVKSKFQKIMKELDKRAPGKKPPKIRGPRGDNGGGAEEAKGKEGRGGGGEGGSGQGGGNAAQQQGKGGSQQDGSGRHRFEITW